MTSLSLGIVIEGLVAILLLLTIGYCVTLNRRLQRLRADEETMRATISELITATEIAERAILGLKATANDCEKSMTARLAEAEHVGGRLSEQINAGEAVFQRIVQIASAAKTPPPVRPPAPPEPAEIETPVTVSTPSLSTAANLKTAADQAAERVRNLRRMTGDQAA